MAENTVRLGLVKPGGGSTGLITPPDLADVDVLNANFDKIDAAIGGQVVTSTTLPSSPFDGKIVFESDTKRTKIWLAASQTWITVASMSDTGWVSDSMVTTNDYWDLSESRTRVVGDYFAYTYLRVKRLKSGHASPGTGNIVNAPLTQLKEAYRPGQMGAQSLSSSHTGAVCSGYINDEGKIYLSAIGYDEADNEIDVGTEFTLAGMFLREV